MKRVGKEFTPTPICIVGEKRKNMQKQVRGQINSSMAINKLVRGFTLIELVVVVLIMGVLAVITVPKLAMSVINLGKSDTGAERMAAAIRHCRTLAISNAATNQEGSKLSMKDMNAENSYTRFEIAPIVGGQPGTIVESGTIPSGITCTGADDFVFGPLGNRTGDNDNLTVSASGGGKTYVISVVRSTGMVKCTQQ
jgi:prepilin-type N-terminal cleavage/methylation domain-containing protein